MTHVQLLELYTSQGCSSCPPAESWISRWQEDDRLWGAVVPVAFHVDYWNRIGWVDPFSDHSHTRRQRRYASVWGRPDLYTPEFVVDGQEWRGWFEQSPLPAAEDSSGVLRLSWDGRQADLVYRPVPATRRATTATVALLQMGQATNVTSGENAGRMMVGDFVVVGWQETGLHKEGDAWHASMQIDTDKQISAIAAWVTARPQGVVLQATGGWLRDAP
ncbi:MAG: DUF1223 domain-containing protein [Gemmatimonadetes bacterium]|nr:DUF1223 domain-containing protein [Gemmatimonadota bacterium]MBT6148635.1 DUF1223 domain-containing protein [Gemmatimonadota bacterium]MBT7860787.1 DUF1223 domain-containing protein [Gemmatimonadota bacterium]